MKTLTKLLAITCFACLFTSCKKIEIPSIPIDGIHSQNIIGQWQLICVEKSVAGGGGTIKTTNYKSKNIIFHFFSNEKMSINKNGFLPKGEYFYYYRSWSDNKVNEPVFDIPGFNLIITNNEDIFSIDGSFYWYCNQVEGSNDMVLWNPGKEGFGECAYLVKIN